MNTFRRILSASAAFLLALQLGNAQQTVKGVVKDNETNQPIPGSVVSIPNTTTATSTDGQGMFTLQSQSKFDSITVSSVGYGSVTIAADKSNSMSITLKASSNELNEVQVLGVKKGYSVTTLNSTDLNRSSGLSLQDALNLVPGVEMQNREAWGGDRIIIRGYIPNLGSLGNLSVNTGSGYGYMAYINGIPITDATGNTILDDVDMASLGQVQVIKGPSSALYGSYVGGAVNMYTPTVAPGTTSIQEQAIGGSYGLFRTTTTLATATDKSSIWVNYGDQNYNGFRPNDASKSEFAEFALNYKTSNQNSLSTFFSYNNSLQELSGELDSDAVYGRQSIGDANYDLNSSKVSMEGMRGGMTDTYTFNSHVSNDMTVFLTTRTISQIIAHGYTDYQDGDWGGRDAFNLHFGIVDGIVGASFQKLNQTSDGFNVSHTILPPFAPSQGSFSYAQNYAYNANIFTQWTVKLPSNLSITVGASENYSKYSTENMASSNTFGPPFYNQPKAYTGGPVPAFTPSASLIKIFNENLSVYASVGTGYTPPSLGSIINSANQIVGGLKPETGIQYEIGTKGTLANSKFSYQLALYDLDVTNRFITEYSQGVSYTANVGEQRDMGAELYAAYDIVNNKNQGLSLVRPWISYTYDDAKYVSFDAYTKAKIGGNDSILTSYTGNKAVGVAPNTFNAGIDFNTKMGFYLHITNQYVDKVPFTFDNQHYMSSYDLLNGKLGYAHQFGHLSLDAFVGVNNALSQTYYTSVFFAANITDLAQGTDPNYLAAFKAAGINKPNIGSGGDGYILPAPYTATFFGGLSLKYTF